MILAQVDKKLLLPAVEKISRLYSSMDFSYSKAAAYYGFECSGCDQNCCEEKFFHYTLSEHVYLMEGMNSLDEDPRNEIFARAEKVMHIYGIHDLQGIVKRTMCPLNSEGRCILYRFRPMICRLHGIPHTFSRPGEPQQSGPGCHKFDSLFSHHDRPQFDFDRSAFYTAMAAVEIGLRKTLDFRGRYRKTVAAMILDISGNRA